MCNVVTIIDSASSDVKIEESEMREAQLLQEQENIWLEEESAILNEDSIEGVAATALTPAVVVAETASTVPEIENNTEDFDSNSQIAGDLVHTRPAIECFEGMAVSLSSEEVSVVTAIRRGDKVIVMTPDVHDTLEAEKNQRFAIDYLASVITEGKPFVATEIYYACSEHGKDVLRLQSELTQEGVIAQAMLQLVPMLVDVMHHNEDPALIVEQFESIRDQAIAAQVAALQQNTVSHDESVEPTTEKTVVRTRKPRKGN